MRFCAAFGAFLLCCCAAGSSITHNVLHIVVDDLRPELGAYGLANRHTPNIDKIAADGTVFDRAYCQQAVCGPSRNSFLSGRRPDASRSWNFINHFREDHPEWTSLPGLFLREGWKSLGSGKIYHPKLPPAYDGAKSWSQEALPFKNPCWNSADWNNTFPSKDQDGGLPCVFCPIDVKGFLFKNQNKTVGNDWCEIDAFEDSFSIDEAISLLRKAKGGRFYLAVGLHKPHYPFQAAKEDFDKHPLDGVDLARNPYPPRGMPNISFHFTEDSAHADPWHPIPDKDARAARRAYRAATTGMDRKLGKLLDELDSLGITNETAVVLHGDHGWQLGEHGEWRKMTNFELAARVPLIIRAPWLQQAPRRSAGLAELVDLLPTIAELAGISLPQGESFDGVSLVPLLNGSQSAVKEAAFTQYPRRVSRPDEAWKGNSIIHHDRSTFTHMGYSVRTQQWRYTEWVAWNQTALAPIWDNVVGRELYDHRSQVSYPTDFDATENVNQASNASLGSEVAALSKMIRSQFSPQSIYSR